MILWTIKPKYYYDNILENGISSPIVLRKHHTDKSFDQFKKSYDWMIDQAKQRKKWRTDDLIWCWTSRPDLRRDRFHSCDCCPKIENFVLLKISIPDDNVLVSSFNRWHYVLNDIEKDEWEKIFVLEKNERKQAVIDLIKKENILDVIQFKMVNKWKWEIL